MIFGDESVEGRPVTWLDFVLVAIPPAMAVLGSERRLMGLALGIAAVLLLRPLVLIGNMSPIAALAVALVAGVAVAMLVRAVVPQRRTRVRYQYVLGGIGGFAIGVVLVLAFVTSLPIQRNPVNAREIFYPPRNLPEPLNQAVTRSRLVELGRDILLFPLLDGRVPFSETERVVYGNLHDYLVIGTPWER